MNRLQQYVADLQTYIKLVEELTADGRDAFWEDIRTQLAVIRCYEVIGEIAKRFPSTLLSQYPAVSWSDVKRFRDFLAHNYDTVDLEYVWQAVEQLPTLKTTVEAMATSPEVTAEDNEEDTI